MLRIDTCSTDSAVRREYVKSKVSSVPVKTLHGFGETEFVEHQEMPLVGDVGAFVIRDGKEIIASQHLVAAGLGLLQAPRAMTIEVPQPR